MKIEIDIQFSRKDFEGIYYRDSQADYFKSPIIKSAFRDLLLGIVTLIVFLIYGIIKSEYTMFIIWSIIFVVILGNYIHTFKKLVEWKKSIQVYLDREEKYSKNKLILSDEYFSLIQDEKETIEHWSNFKKVQIEENYISLDGKENYLIPKKSMSAENYKLLKDFISEKLK